MFAQKVSPISVTVFTCWPITMSTSTLSLLPDYQIHYFQVPNWVSLWLSFKATSISQSPSSIHSYASWIKFLYLVFIGSVDCLFMLQQIKKIRDSALSSGEEICEDLSAVWQLSPEQRGSTMSHPSGKIEDRGTGSSHCYWVMSCVFTLAQLERILRQKSFHICSSPTIIRASTAASQLASSHWHTFDSSWTSNHWPQHQWQAKVESGLSHLVLLSPACLASPCRQLFPESPNAVSLSGNPQKDFLHTGCEMWTVLLHLLSIIANSTYHLPRSSRSA